MLFFVLFCFLQLFKKIYRVLIVVSMKSCFGGGDGTCGFFLYFMEVIQVFVLPFSTCSFCGVFFLCCWCKGSS